MAQPNHFPAFEAPLQQGGDAHPLQALIRRLAEAFGPPGSEEPVRNLIREEIKSFADELRVDRLGNLIAKKRGSGAAPRPKVMLTAHMDEIGFMVSHIDENGFCRFGSLGPTEHLALLGQRCVFVNGTVGVIGREQKKSKAKEIEFERLFIDVGANGKANVPVKVGDAATFAGPFRDDGGRIIAKALDDRAGCAVLIETMRQLKKSTNDVYFVFTAQEQVGSRGSTTSAFGLQPDFALAVDTTDTGDTPESETIQVALGHGPAIKIKDSNVLVSPAVRNVLIEAAREAKVPYQFEVVTSASAGTGALQLTREGTHAGALSIPLRYIHTASEMADLEDIQNATRLLTALIARPFHLNGQ